MQISDIVVAAAAAAAQRRVNKVQPQMMSLSGERDNKEMLPAACQSNDGQNLRRRNNKNRRNERKRG